MFFFIFNIVKLKTTLINLIIQIGRSSTEGLKIPKRMASLAESGFKMEGYHQKIKILASSYSVIYVNIYGMYAR